VTRRRNKRPQNRTTVKARAATGPAPGMAAERSTPLNDLLNQATARRLINANPLARDPRDNDNFGPGTALTPAALDPGRDDTGRPEPRGSEYDVSWNLRLSGDRLIPWQILRDAADGVSIIRGAIRTRKKHVRGLKWGWTVSADAISAAYEADPRRGQDDIAAELRSKYRPEIARLTAFWTNPWRGHLRGLGAWLNMLQEEVIVLDALAIYPQRTIGGDVHSFRILDGTTIKPLLDRQGHTPVSPYPAYQQLLYGFPRGEFAATPVTDDEGRLLLDADGHMQVDNPYPADQLFYWREEPRSFTPYGQSDVERALIDARLYLKRQGWMFAEYDDGATPVTWLVPEGADAEHLDYRQRRKWEDSLNDEMSGHTRARHRIKVTPPGFRPEYPPMVDERYKPEYDLHLIKLVTMHMGVTIAEQGFTEAKGLGSAGYHEGQEDVQDRVGRRPDSEMLAEIIQSLSRDYLDAPPELEFQFNGLESEDEGAADQVADSRIRAGRMTLNEDRRRLGLPLYAFAEADMPMIVTQRGVVFLEQSSLQAPPGELVEPIQAPKRTDADGDGQPDSADEEPAADDGSSDNGGRQATGTKQPATAKSAAPDPPHVIPNLTPEQVAEVVAFRRYIAKRGGAARRPFLFKALTEQQARTAQLLTDTTTGLAEFVTADRPKAQARSWPGWERDEATAAAYARRLNTTAATAVDERTLADDWFTERGTAKAATGRGADAAAWLIARGVARDLAEALAEVLADAYTEGWLIGDRSAVAVVTRTTVDWGAWEPGDPDAARLILGGAGNGSGLAQLLDEAGITIQSIAATRMDELGRALAAALEAGDSPDKLARTLRGILTDPSWADMVAVTEINRAVSAATLATYYEMGVPAKGWMTAADDRVCPHICEPNAIDGAIPLAAAFSSGDMAPPGHPLCRCALDAADLPATETDPGDLS
jgi:SPP1 gp7 family putative phage head morphogenesis protein